MGVSTFAHPYYQAFALPRVKDKQRSQPTPSDYIFNQMLYIIVLYSNSRDIIYPRKRSRCIIFCNTIQSCEV